MAEPIRDPQYWKSRLEQARQAQRLHLAVFRCPLDRWEAIECKHRHLLQRHVQPHDSVLDVGCGYGRLLDLMPSHWRGDYLGIDLSPDLVELAKRLHPEQSPFPPYRDFRVVDAEEYGIVQPASRGKPIDCRFELAVMISFRPMIRRNLGEEVWQRIEANVGQVSKRQLYLEYDEVDEGELTCWERLVKTDAGTKRTMEEAGTTAGSGEGARPSGEVGGTS